MKKIFLGLLIVFIFPVSVEAKTLHIKRNVHLIKSCNEYTNNIVTIANTGGNTIIGNTYNNGNITTGDAIVNVKVKTIIGYTRVIIR